MTSKKKTLLLIPLIFGFALLVFFTQKPCRTPAIFEDSDFDSVDVSAKILLKRISKLDPVGLAECHFRGGDQRLLALDGIVPEVPNLQSDEKISFKLRFIVGTGDFVEDENYSEWRSSARTFAGRYNLKKISLVKGY